MPNEHPMQAQTDQAKAQLGVATFLQGHLIPQGQAPETSTFTPNQAQKPQNDSSPQDGKNPEMDSIELTLSKKFDELAKEIKDNQKLEIDSIRNDIKDALQQEDAEEK